MPNFQVHPDCSPDNLNLAALLAVNTMRNLSREQKLMEEFLLDEGLTLIRSFEAGARTTMMHEMMGGDLSIEVDRISA